MGGLFAFGYFGGVVSNDFPMLPTKVLKDGLRFRHAVPNAQTVCVHAPALLVPKTCGLKESLRLLLRLVTALIQIDWPHVWVPLKLEPPSTNLDFMVRAPKIDKGSNTAELVKTGLHIGSISNSASRAPRETRLPDFFPFTATACTPTVTGTAGSSTHAMPFAICDFPSPPELWPTARWPSAKRLTLSTAASARVSLSLKSFI
jgi:hypothetical protein